jgi:hypothetical protein
MCETGTGQKVAHLHDSYTTTTTIAVAATLQYSSKVLREEDFWVGV